MPNPETIKTPTDVIAAFAVASMRAQAIAQWHEAAAILEEYASGLEAGTYPKTDGPETCRLVAELFRRISDGLDTKNGK